MTGSYMIPDFRQLQTSFSLSQEHGLCFEYNDFCHPEMLDHPGAVKERIQTYLSLGRDCSRDTMHGAFFDVTVFSCDPKIREVSLLRMLQSMEIAKEMGLRAVVFHGNYLPFLRRESYDASWLSHTESAIRTLAKEYPGIDIYLENMFEDTPELLAELARRLSDVDTFGICLDYAHALLTSGAAEPWIKTLAPYLRHMHINDHAFDGDVHMAIGDGKTDWQEFLRLKMQYVPEATVLYEVKGLPELETSLKYMDGLEKLEGK